MTGRGMDTDKIAGFVDAINKENLKRLAWFSKNYEKLAAENRKNGKKLTDGVYVISRKKFMMGALGNEKFIGGYDNRYNLAYNSERESEVRRKLKWFENHFDLCYGRVPKEQVPKGAKILWEELTKRRAETAQSSPRHVIKKKPVGLPKRDLTVNLDVMKPVPPEVHDLIYQGISHEDEGRRGYLKVRYQDDPEDKFYFSDCTNWVYGWGVNAVELHKLWRIPRVQIIKQSFYRRGGVERDPDHYRDAVKTEAPMFFPQL